MNDIELLTTYEPIICYTKGEMFFPCPVEGYVKRASLWMRSENGEEEGLVKEGHLTLEELARHGETSEDRALYMRFVREPLPASEYSQWRSRSARLAFRAPGRLARVGLASRIVDGLLDISLIIRGTVPGGTTAKAEIKYRDILRESPNPVYYGRVVRNGDYIILHYCYFYVMNDWRSSFNGVNEHEADWEQVFVYLADDGTADPKPLWVSYASHDYSGANLRRRWDDPELHIWHETHPVVYAGAGSHASYFLPGEYLMGIEPRYLRPIRNLILGLQNHWYSTLGQGQGNHQREAEAVRTLLSVPYIDYARGDGVAIGIHQERSWSMVLLDSDMGWIENYRGLWGLDTNDFIEGERAPAGPKFNRDGSVRQSWYDPLGWVGLDKVTPPHLTVHYLKLHIAELGAERDRIEQEIHSQRQKLRQAALETDALQFTEHLNPLHDAQRSATDKAQQDLQNLYAHKTELSESIAACESYLSRVEEGDWGDPQAHLTRIHRPEASAKKQTRLVELWAATSVGLLLFVLAGLLAYNRSQWLLRALLVIAGFVAMEAAIRGQLANLLLNMTILLAILTLLILIYEFFWPIIVGLLLILVIYMIADNLRELSST